MHFQQFALSFFEKYSNPYFSEDLYFDLNMHKFLGPILQKKCILLHMQDSSMYRANSM